MSTNAQWTAPEQPDCKGCGKPFYPLPRGAGRPRLFCVECRPPVLCSTGCGKSVRVGGLCSRHFHEWLVGR